MENECEKIECESLEKGEIKTLNFGVKGSRAEKDLATVKYDKRKVKVVKAKKKINPRLKKELLKNYGFVIEDN